MLTEIDDFTIHQTPGTMDQVQGRNPRWLDKLWFHIGTTDGRLSVAGHMGVYPATQTMDAAAAVTFDGKLYSARFARACKTDRDNRQVGPLAAAVVEHFRSWRFVLEPAAGRDARRQGFLRPPSLRSRTLSVHAQRGFVTLGLDRRRALGAGATDLGDGRNGTPVPFPGVRGPA